MEVKKLINKMAVRTKPCETSYGKDNSYRDSPIRILKVTESHIVFRSSFGNIHLLSEEWIDDNWVDYDELIFDIELGDK